MIDGSIPNKTLTKCIFFLDRTVYQKIGELAKKTGQSKSEIVRDWIRELEELRIKGNIENG